MDKGKLKEQSSSSCSLSKVKNNPIKKKKIYTLKNISASNVSSSNLKIMVRDKQFKNKLSKDKLDQEHFQTLKTGNKETNANVSHKSSKQIVGSLKRKNVPEISQSDKKISLIVKNNLVIEKVNHWMNDPNFDKDKTVENEITPEIDISNEKSLIDNFNEGDEDFEVEDDDDESIEDEDEEIEEEESDESTELEEESDGYTEQEEEIINKINNMFNQLTSITVFNRFQSDDIKTKMLLLLMVILFVVQIDRNRRMLIRRRRRRRTANRSLVLS